MQKSFLTAAAKKAQLQKSINGTEAAKMLYGGFSLDDARELIGKKQLLTREDLAIYSEPSTETALQASFVDWLGIHYPLSIFLASAGGIKLPIGLALKAKQQGIVRKGYPDFYLFKRTGEHVGLAMDFKVFGTRLQTQKGTWATPHLADQAAVLAQFRQEGWAADFAIGLSGAKRLTDAYIHGEPSQWP